MSHWLISTPLVSAAENQKEQFTAKFGKLVESISIVNVPLNLKFTSFDTLIKLTDDLAKADTVAEQVVRRSEKSLLDLDNSVALSVSHNRKDIPSHQFLTESFSWDESKFPKSRTINDTLTILISQVVKTDEEVKQRTSQLFELKQQQQMYLKSTQMSYMQKDLVDVITPDICDSSLFVDTEHLSTLVVIVPRNSDEEFLAKYSTFSELVVPESAIKLSIPTDKDGNTLYRVVLFKSQLEAFKEAARNHRFLAKEFKFDPAHFEETKKRREEIDVEIKRQENMSKKIFAAAYSDAFSAWIHLKVMRIFVESVLRWGLPVKFACFAIGVKSSGQSKIKRELCSMYGTGAETVADEGDDEVYYPFVWLPMQVYSAK
jgi:V-type H+-transporting ATPase subunit C